MLFALRPLCLGCIHLFSILTYLLISVIPADAGWEEGLAAHTRGDYAMAWEEWHPLATQGYVLAQHSLGVMLSKGNGVPVDHHEAIRWYRKAADQGYSASQYNLGFKYYHGEGVAQDYHEALHWYRLAAAQGVPLAQQQLGMMYTKGTGVAQNYEEALQWYRLAADQGEKTAMFNVGVHYQYGLGIAKDLVQAHKWYHLCALAGFDEGARWRETVAQRMTPAQIADAQQLAREWRPTTR